MAGYSLKDMMEFKPKKSRSGRTQRDSMQKTNGSIALNLWGNTIATLNPKKKTMNVTSAGWHTKTTKDRLNKVLPAGYHVVQRQGEWFLVTPSGKTVPFKNGMRINV